MKVKEFSFLTIMVLIGFGSLARLPGAAAGPLITEVLAKNTGSHTDQDGDTSDWIEIFNDGAAPASLQGWSLTDDPAALGKWMFPAVALPPGGFLVVYASEKNLSDPAGQLHTNFKLQDGGEYLAMVAADGTIAMQFQPKFPPQEEDISFVLAQEGGVTPLIAANAPASNLVPSGDLGLAWTQPGFNDAGWIGGSTGIGYDRNPDYLPLISTNLRASMDGVNPTAYIRVPFAVANPSQLNLLKLRMKYDDGYAAYINGVLVASRAAPAALAWNSAATSTRDEALAVVFEEVDIPVTAGLLKAGANVLAIHGLNASAGSSDFLIVPELDGFSAGAVNTDTVFYFAQPTPGYANGSGYPGIAARPSFSRPGGAFSGSFPLILTAAPGAAIRYTLDRTEPSASSPAYSAPLSISTSTMVRARAFQPGLVPSPVESRTYIGLDASVSNFSSNLPIAIFNTFGQGINDTAQTLTYVGIINNAAGARNALIDPPEFSGRGAIKWRGSSSLGFPKKNFALEIWNEKNFDLEVPLLGMPEESDWILLGPYTDKTLMRDPLAYEWSNDAGRYAVRSRFIELYVDSGGGNLTSADYAGVYVFMEKIKRDRNRVDIHKLLVSDSNAPDISGGYILKIDRLDPGDAGFTTSSGLRLAYVYPKEQEITAAQRAWLTGYLNEFEGALFGLNFKDPLIGYARYIDAGSFIDHHILVEMTKNIDGFRLSTFMFKDRGGKLNMGPIWDYNLCLGNANYLNGWTTDGWYYSQLSGNDYAWWPRLFQDPNFVQKYIDRWTELRRDRFATGKLLASVDRNVGILSEAQVRNFQRWPVLGTYVWPNQFIGNTYQEEIGFMKNWIIGRMAWIDGNWAVAPAFNKLGGSIDPGFSLTMSAPAGTIYYTLDGSDPRALTGNPAATAKTYSGAITLNQNTRAIARARSTKGWSGLTDATFVVAMPPLVITEIMYHPADPPPNSPYDADDFEFIELLNLGASPMNLNGARLAGGVSFDFTGSAVTSLPPGTYVLVVKNLAAFSSRYDTAGLLIAGEFTGNLDNAGEAVSLRGPLNEAILDFAYSEAWQPSTDGQGFSLVIADPGAPWSAWGDGAGWLASRYVGGSPGEADPGQSAVGGRRLPGDANQDAQLDLADAVSILLRLFGRASGPLPCEGASIAEGGNLPLLDLNGDAGVDISDAIHILQYLFQHGPPPVLGARCTRIAGCAEACLR
ncbi:MAG: CotH kinase family protein [Planctomycetes bacterium]|nr:CotH kinase family protein [Planctomycetota bacterium]